MAAESVPVELDSQSWPVPHLQVPAVLQDGLVHDGARPLVTPRLIEDGIAAALETGASSAGLPVVDTLKEVASDNSVLWTVERERLWSVQTPQVFRFELLNEAHDRDDLEATDDAGLVERIGGRVQLFPGSPENLKVTTSGDLLMAAALLHSRRVGSPKP